MSDTPPVKRYKTGDRLHVQAQRIWVILVGFVMNSKRDPKAPAHITYGEVAEAMAYGDRRAGHTLGRQLGIIAKFCVDNNLPALNAIVVNQETRLPGSDVLLRDGKSVSQEQAAVMRQDWYAIRVPSTGTLRRVWESWGAEESSDDDDDE